MLLIYDIFCHMGKRQYFGIKFPFVVGNEEHYTLNLNRSRKDKAISSILHVLFTPKRQRLRMPTFGTDLIRFIFDGKQDDNWEDIKSEIRNSVTSWVNGAYIDDIEVVSTEDGREIYVKVSFTLTNGNTSESDKLIVRL